MIRIGNLCQVAALLTLLSLGGCNLVHPLAPSEGSSEVGGGHYLPKESAISPSHSPPSRAILTLSGSPFTVDVKAKKDQSKFTITLVKGDRELDHEEYVAGSEMFQIRVAGGETYNPPIDLLRFPMKVGDSWTWSGKLDSGVKADAKIDTSKDTVYVGTVPQPAVKVEVSLRFLALGGDDHAQRTLTFWFSPKHGLFKRQYDNLSIREPAP